ncbi:MAG TPA: DHA2 family efflux MFS transporter permease subunit [Trebonia sp.]|jgi:EmrB/QacA subfamily drug resistance transporter
MSSPRDVTHSARRWLALVAIAASVLVVGLDLTVLNLALPTMSVSLHASTGDLQWIVDSYSLVLAALILPAGLLGDRYGRKRMLLISLVLFGVSSAACAYASSVGELIVARAVLGIGAAAIFPLALSVLPVLFAPEERQKAVAAIAGSTMLSFPIGPIVGGYLLSHFWWGSVFLINVPIVVIALVAVATLMPESRSAKRPSIDLSGLAISTIGLVALTYGFIEAGQDGWSNARALALIAAGIVMLALLPVVERRIARRGGQPLADLQLFRSPGFRWGTVLATLVSFVMFGMFFALPQYFQDVRGANALGSGIRLLPMIGGMLVGMVGGTRLSAPRNGGAAPTGPRTLVTAGYLLMAAAMALGALTTLGSSTGYVLGWVALSGLGLGLVMPSAMGVALGALSAERSGAGSALLTAMRQVGSTIGVAVLGTVISNSYSSGVAGVAGHLPAQAAAAVRSSLGSGVAVAGKLGSPSLVDTIRTAFVHGMDLMLWTCGGIAVGCAVLAVIVLRNRPGSAAEADTEAEAEAGSLPVM